MYLLTDGKNYVMRNPMELQTYMTTTSEPMAEKFSYKQARGVLQSSRKKYKWMKDFYILDQESRETVKNARNEKTNKSIYAGKKDVNIDDNILAEIIKEKDSILHLEGWNVNQLITMKNQLSAMIGKYDSALSDVEHSLQCYSLEHNGKKPAAHKMSKIAYLIEELRIKRNETKEAFRYIEVMEHAINNKYSLEKLKLELSKIEHKEYQGRTEYYSIALNILND